MIKTFEILTIPYVNIMSTHYTLKSGGTYVYQHYNGRVEIAIDLDIRITYTLLSVIIQQLKCEPDLKRTTRGILTPILVYYNAWVLKYQTKTLKFGVSLFKEKIK